MKRIANIDARSAHRANDPSRSTSKFSQHAPQFPSIIHTFPHPPIGQKKKKKRKSFDSHLSPPLSPIQIHLNRNIVPKLPLRNQRLPQHRLHHSIIHNALNPHLLAAADDIPVNKLDLGPATPAHIR